MEKNVCRYNSLVIITLSFSFARSIIFVFSLILLHLFYFFFFQNLKKKNKNEVRLSVNLVIFLIVLNVSVCVFFYKFNSDLVNRIDCVCRVTNYESVIWCAGVIVICESEIEKKRKLILIKFHSKIFLKIIFVFFLQLEVSGILPT